MRGRRPGSRKGCASGPPGAWPWGAGGGGGVGSPGPTAPRAKPRFRASETSGARGPPRSPPVSAPPPGGTAGATGAGTGAGTGTGCSLWVLSRSPRVAAARGSGASKSNRKVLQPFARRAGSLPFRFSFLRPFSSFTHTVFHGPSSRTGMCFMVRTARETGTWGARDARPLRSPARRATLPGAAPRGGVGRAPLPLPRPRPLAGQLRRRLRGAAAPCAPERSGCPPEPLPPGRPSAERPLRSVCVCLASVYTEASSRDQ